MTDFIKKIDMFRSDSDALANFQFIVLALIFGLIISFIIVYYQRRVLGSFIRAIRNAEAIDAESAKTLAELGQEDNISAIHKLQSSTSLRNLISICDMTESEKGKVIIDETTRFYITAEKEERARKQFGDGEDSIIPIIVGSVVLLTIGILTFFLGK